jgi:hypothetical protein
MYAMVLLVRKEQPVLKVLLVLQVLKVKQVLLTLEHLLD